jgi:hypothetical protein
MSRVKRLGESRRQSWRDNAFPEARRGARRARRRSVRRQLDLLQRLDAAIADAYESGICVDEINPPPES